MIRPEFMGHLSPIKSLVVPICDNAHQKNVVISNSCYTMEEDCGDRWEKERERKNVKIGGESDELGATFLFIFWNTNKIL